MKVLVINTGSSSIKYRLFDMAGIHVLAEGLVERIGQEGSSIHHKVFKNGSTDSFTQTEPVPEHRTGLNRIAALLTDSKYGSVKTSDEIEAVGHRVVHGGEDFHVPALITDDIIGAIKKNIPLAPLHNPANLTGIEVARMVFSGAKHIAVFDTAFHQTMKPYSYMYAIPFEMYENFRIRKYGFHGTSHGFVSQEAAGHLGKDPKTLNMITIHLGNGSSMAAIKQGICVDTTMGLTPLAGLMMGTRCGDLDPAVPFFLAENNSCTIERIDNMLNKKSGLYGICGNNDMREILQNMEQGCEKSKLAVEMLTYQIKKYIGAYYAALGRLDVMVFTAGIGENVPLIRKLACENLEELGINIDNDRNNDPGRGIRTISSADSRVTVLVVPTNEELKIARDVKTVLDEICCQK